MAENLGREGQCGSRRNGHALANPVPEDDSYFACSANQPANTLHATELRIEDNHQPDEQNAGILWMIGRFSQPQGYGAELQRH